jgi:hypothetical protein
MDNNYIQETSYYIDDPELSRFKIESVVRSPIGNPDNIPFSRGCHNAISFKIYAHTGIAAEVRLTGSNTEYLDHPKLDVSYRPSFKDIYKKENEICKYALQNREEIVVFLYMDIWYRNYLSLFDIKGCRMLSNKSFYHNLYTGASSANETLFGKGWETMSNESRKIIFKERYIDPHFNITIV